MRQLSYLIVVLLGAALLFSSCGTDVSAEPDPEVPATPSERQVDIELHLPESDGGWLEERTETVEVRGEPLEAVVLQRWMKSIEHLPTAVEADAELRGETVYVSFNEAIRDISLDWEGIIVKSLVSTLVEIDGAETVQILVDGKKVGTLAGNSAVGEPLGPDDAVLAREDFTPIEPADTREGEVFIYGELLEVPDPMQGSTVGWIEIEQHIADAQTPEIDPKIALTIDVVINRQEIDAEGNDSYSMMTVEDLEPGMIVGIVLNDKGMARSIIVEEHEK
ncbi:MAG: GerMN domain-containing protein [Clostridia bacterium]